MVLFRKRKRKKPRIIIEAKAQTINFRNGNKFGYSAELCNRMPLLDTVNLQAWVQLIEKEPRGGRWGLLLSTHEIGGLSHQ